MAAHFTTIPALWPLSLLLDRWRNIAISLIDRILANKWRKLVLTPVFVNHRIKSRD
jgi:hypothetical protein